MIAEKIRDGVLEGRFAPGQRLIEADLQREFNISRGPLREALRRLASEGVIDIVHFKGAVVRRLSRKEIADLFRIRASLEGLAARTAAENIETGDNKERLRALMDTDLVFKPGTSAQARSRSNILFHAYIIETAENEQLANLVKQLRLPLLRLQIRYAIDDEYSKASYAEHREIANAVLKGEPEAAEQAMKRHLMNAMDRVLAAPNTV